MESCSPETCELNYRIGAFKSKFYFEIVGKAKNACDIKTVGPLGDKPIICPLNKTQQRILKNLAKDLSAQKSFVFKRDDCKSPSDNCRLHVGKNSYLNVMRMMQLWGKCRIPPEAKSDRESTN
jgi:hypothetical protein